MGRLTYKIDENRPVWGLSNNNDIYAVYAGWRGKAVDQLAAYEDTGLTPEEVKNLQVENERLKNQNKLFTEIHDTIKCTGGKTRELLDENGQLLLENAELKKAFKELEEQALRAVESYETSVKINSKALKIKDDEIAELKARLEKAVELPIPVGTTVYVLEKKIGSPRFDFVRKRFINSYGLATEGYKNVQLMVPEGDYDYPVSDIFYTLDKIDKVVFLTLVEAEAHLKELEEKK